MTQILRAQFEIPSVPLDDLLLPEPADISKLSMRAPFLKARMEEVLDVKLTIQVNIFHKHIISMPLPVHEYDLRNPYDKEIIRGARSFDQAIAVMYNFISGIGSMRDHFIRRRVSPTEVIIYKYNPRHDAFWIMQPKQARELMDFLKYKPA